MATTWQATAHVFDVQATRHALLIDEFAHHRLTRWQPDRIAAALAYDLPLDFVCRGRWIADHLAELRPDARAFVVEDGVDKTIFNAEGREEQAPGTPLRIVVDDRHVPAGNESLARAALDRDAPEITHADDPRARAQKLRDADVVLHLDEVGGLAAPVLEALHCGAVPIVLPGGGAGQVVEHDVNGIVAEADDVRGVAHWLKALETDRERLRRLRDAGAQTAAAWPDPAAAQQALDAALEQMVAEEPPPASRWPSRLMSDAMAAATLFTIEHIELETAFNRIEKGEPYRIGLWLLQRWRALMPEPIRRIGRSIIGGKSLQ
jgi:hypothetical protein